MVTLDALHTILLWLLIAVLAFTMLQRKHHAYGEKKRTTTLMFAGGIMVLVVAIIFIRRFSLPPWTFFIAVGIEVLLFFIYREAIPFSRRCSRCGKRVSIKSFLFFDNNLCDECSEKHEKLTDTT